MIGGSDVLVGCARQENGEREEHFVNRWPTRTVYNDIAKIKADKYRSSLIGNKIIKPV